MRLDGPQNIGPVSSQANVQQARVEVNGREYPVKVPPQEQTFDTSVAKQNQGKGTAVQFEGNNNAFTEATNYTEADFKYTTSTNGQQVKTGFSKSERKAIADAYNTANENLGEIYGDIQKRLSKAGNDPVAQSYYDELVAYTPKAPNVKSTSGKTLQSITKYETEMKNNLEAIKDGYISDKLDRLEAKIDRNAGLTLGVGTALTDQIDQATGAVLASNEEQTQQLEGDIEKEGAATRGTVHSEATAIRKTVHSEGTATRGAVNQAAQSVKNTVSEEAGATRGLVHQEGVRGRRVTREENARTRDVVREENEETRNAADPLHINRGIRAGAEAVEDFGRGVRDAARRIVRGSN